MPRVLSLALVAIVLTTPTTGSAQVDRIYGGRASLPPRVAEAFVDSLRQSLRNLVTSQEAYFSDHNTYAKRFEYGRQKGAVIQPPVGVTLTLTYATATSWAGRATHDLLPGMSCVIEIGGVPPSRRLKTAGGLSTEEEGVPMCDRP